jgi:large subunit ribosomal protein L4
MEDFSLAQPKTKELVAVLGKLNLSGSVLLLVESSPRELLLAARNIPWLTVLPARQLGAYDALRHDVLLFTERGLAVLTGKAGAA